MKTARVVIPCLIAVIGLMAITGCFFVPTFNGVVEGDDAAAKIGDANSKKPLRIGTSTRDDVIRVLGPPEPEVKGEGRLLYTWKVQNGAWVWPLCFSAAGQFGVRGLELNFDDSGTLRSCNVLKVDGDPYRLHPDAPLTWYRGKE